MKSWVIVVASAASLGLLAEDAMAQRSRSFSSSGQQHRQSGQPRHNYSQHHGHYHNHWHGSGILFAPSIWYWPGSYYYDPAPVYVAPAVAPSTNSGYWYFCPDSRAFYPYVQECRSGWQAMVPGSPPPN